MVKFTRQYPVFGGINDEKWLWLCDNISKPAVNWRCRKGAIWFVKESDRTLYLLKWA